MKKSLCIILFINSLFSLATNNLKVPSFFSDHMVLQRDITSVFGTTTPNTKVTISIANAIKTITASQQGKWKATIKGLKAGGPYILKIFTDNDVLTFNDVYIGDVWLASGQSNMEWSPKRGIAGWDKEKKFANYSKIRLLNIKRNPQGEIQEDFKNHSWQICNPKNLFNFSAVAYFFAKYTHLDQNIPIGIINSSFGGSKIEAWMSKEALNASSISNTEVLSKNEFKDLRVKNDINIAYRNEIFEKVNVGERLGVHLNHFDDSNWSTFKNPSNWVNTKLKNSGFVWFRKDINIKDATFLKDSCKLSFGRTRHQAIVYINGNKVGELIDGKNKFLHFSSKFLQAGKNVIAVRIVRKLGVSAGFMGNASEMYLKSGTNNSQKISLSGLWKFNNKLEPKFTNPVIFHHKPTLLYNGMIAPLLGYSIKGFLWYQGESNTYTNASIYDNLLHSLINDWRNKFDATKAPFLIVQLPNFRAHQNAPVNNHNWPILRESQSKLDKLYNVDYIVTLDLGNANNIHPTNKKDVGYRLSLLAKKNAYGNKNLKLFPKVKKVQLNDTNILVTFNDVHKKLVSKDSKPIREFAIAGKDKIFYWAEVKIIGKNSIKLTSKNVKKPLYVRYAWQDNPNINLYNANGLPVAPFRTDN